MVRAKEGPLFNFTSRLQIHTHIVGTLNFGTPETMKLYWCCLESVLGRYGVFWNKDVCQERHYDCLRAPDIMIVWEPLTLIRYVNWVSFYHVLCIKVNLFLQSTVNGSRGVCHFSWQFDKIMHYPHSWTKILLWQHSDDSFLICWTMFLQLRKLYRIEMNDGCER
jgi:hypothetical protein